MTDADKPKFFVLIAGVHSFYRQEISDFANGVWWMAMRLFDLPAVQDALNRHCVNPDNGQFMPKPADVVRLLQGSTQDGALVAWAKVDRAIRQVGTYATVCFDDAIIHRVITDMGGWVAMGSKTEKEWPYLAKEFENRYRGYRTQGGVDDYPRLLVGIAEAQNGQRGLRSQAPVLIGDFSKAKRVLEEGSDKPMLGFTRWAHQESLALEVPSRSAA